MEQRTGGVTEGQSADESGDATGTEYLSLYVAGFIYIHFWLVRK